MFLHLQLHVVTTLFQKLFPKEVKYIPGIFQVPVFITTENIGEKSSDINKMRNKKVQLILMRCKSLFNPPNNPIHTVFS